MELLVILFLYKLYAHINIFKLKYALIFMNFITPSKSNILSDTAPELQSIW